MIRINLLPAETKKKEAGKKIGSMVMGIGILVVAVFAGIYALKVYQYQSLKSDLRTIELQLKPLEAVIQRIDAIEAEKSKLKTKMDVMKGLLKESLIYPIFLEDIARLLPRRAWITSLAAINKPDSLDVKIMASATDNYRVAAFVSMLEKDGCFNDVKLGPINSVQMEKFEIRNFDINCKYLYGKAEK